MMLLEQGRVGAIQQQKTAASSNQTAFSAMAREGRR